MTTASLLGLIALLAGTSAVVAGLFAMPQHRRLFLMAMVFLVCYVKKPFYQELFFVNYRGVDRGFAVTLSDLFFLGFLVWMMLGGFKERLVRLPFNSIPWILLILISCLSLIGSIRPYYGLFTIHKMARCLILYFVMVNMVRDRRDVVAVLTAMAASVVLQGFIVFWDKYVTQAVVARSIGSFRHPNTLTMYCDLVGPILWGALLAGTLAKGRNALFAVAVGCGLICVIFSKSRAGMVLAPASLGIVTAASFLLKPSSRKFSIVAGALLVGCIVAALAMPKIIRRFESAPKESAETREYFNHAAAAMARDRLFGVGINLYSLSLAESDYYWYVYPDMTEVADPEAFRETAKGQSRLGTAHHIYWLYAAETGWPGLVVFVLHIAVFWFYNVYHFLREKEPLFQSVFLGMLVGTSFHHLHGVLEWIFRQTEVLYLYFVMMGLMVAMVAIRKREKAAARNELSRRPAATTPAARRLSVVPVAAGA